VIDIIQIIKLPEVKRLYSDKNMIFFPLQSVYFINTSIKERLGHSRAKVAVAARKRLVRRT